MRVAPELVAPLGDLAAGVEAAAHFDDHRRAERRPRELILAAPLHPHRMAGAAREQRRIERRVVGAVVAVAARAVAMDDRHVLLAQAEHARDLPAQLKTPLRVRPDTELAFAQPGQRARRADRGVREIGPGIGRFELLLRFRAGPRLRDQRHGLAAELRQQLVDLRGLGQRCARAPACRGARGLDGLERLLLARGAHAHETAIDDHLHHSGQRA